MEFGIDVELADNCTLIDNNVTGEIDFMPGSTNNFYRNNVAAGFVGDLASQIDGGGNVVN